MTSPLAKRRVADTPRPRGPCVTVSPDPELDAFCGRFLPTCREDNPSGADAEAIGAAPAPCGERGTRGHAFWPGTAPPRLKRHSATRALDYRRQASIGPGGDITMGTPACADPPVGAVLGLAVAGAAPGGGLRFPVRQPGSWEDGLVYTAAPAHRRSLDMTDRPGGASNAETLAARPVRCHRHASGERVCRPGHAPQAHRDRRP